MSDHRLADGAALLLDHLHQEAGAGFPRVRRIPDSGVIRFLDYIDSLADSGPLLESMARLHAMGLLFSPGSHDTMLRLMDEDPVCVGYRDAMRSPHFSMGLRYAGLRMMKAMLSDPQSAAMMKQTRATLDFTPRDDMPPELVSDPDPAHLKPAKAPQLRKLIDVALKDLFTPFKEKGRGGETLYTGALEGATVKVMINFASRDVQLVHLVSIPDEARSVMVVGRTYEQLWGAGTGWDYLTEENAEASIRLLAENIRELVRLRNRLKAL
ncbi:MAG: hypothetical protein JOZ40_05525 [Methylobacteriaceae bacterium]|nr:hypothetical protein [Methylobacteriaceae bacterium]